MTEGVQLEEFGGDVPAVLVSGLTGEGLPDLLETLSAVAEMQDLQAEHTGPVQGYVIESNLHKGLGFVPAFKSRIMLKLSMQSCCHCFNPEGMPKKWITDYQWF